LVIEFVEEILKSLVDFLESAKKFRALGLGRGVTPGGVFLIHFVVNEPDFLDQPPQILEVSFAALNFLVHDDAIEAFLWRLRNEFLSQRNMFFAGKSK